MAGSGHTEDIFIAKSTNNVICLAYLRKTLKTHSHCNKQSVKTVSSKGALKMMKWWACCLLLLPIQITVHTNTDT